jgi:hypothetical protein
MSRNPNDHDYDDRAERRRDENERRYDERYEQRPRGGIGGVLIGIVGTIAVLAVAGFLARGWIMSQLIPPPISIFPTAGPTPTPSVTTGAMVIKQIQHLSRLESSKYTIETVVEADTPGGFMGFGAEELLLIAHGKVVAGVDLGKLQLQDVTVSADGKTVNVTLPAIEIFDASLDEKQTQVYDRQSGNFITSLFADPDPNLESIARQKGVEQMLRSACEAGILDQAAKDGKQTISQLLSLSGFASVQVDIASPTVSPCAAATNTTPAP